MPKYPPSHSWDTRITMTLEDWEAAGNVEKRPPSAPKKRHDWLD